MQTPTWNFLRNIFRGQVTAKFAEVFAEEN
jgi:hypothetical protein